MILNEEEFVRAFHGGDGVAATQIAAHEIRVERVTRRNGGSANDDDDRASFVVDTGAHRAKGVTVNARRLVIWTGKDVCVYELPSRDNGERVGRSSFPSRARSVAAFRDSLFLAQDDLLLVTDLRGVRRLSVPFSPDREGRPVALGASASDRFLAVATDLGVVRLYDVARRDPRPVAADARLDDDDDDDGATTVVVRSIACAADGARASILVDRRTVGGPSDARLYAHDAVRGDARLVDLGNRIPVSHAWDATEPRLLSCETRRRADATSDADAHMREVTTMFVTADGVFVQDATEIRAPVSAYLVSRAPKLFFAVRDEDDDDGADVGTTHALLRHFDE